MKLMQIHFKDFPKSRSQGMALLAITMALLLIGLITTLFTVRSMATQQRMVTNDFRNTQAFEAAEGGMEYGIAYLNANARNVVQDIDNDGMIDPNPVLLTSNTMSISLSTGSFVVQYSNLIVNNFDMLNISAVGSSQDGLVNKTITQTVYFNQIITTPPVSAITALKNVNLSGNVTIANPEGIQTIILGGNINLGGAASTEPTPGPGSDKKNIKRDITENAFPGVTVTDFFNQYFASPPDIIKNAVNKHYSNSEQTNYSSLLDGVEGQSIWIEQTGGEAQINSNVTIGSPTNPVLLIVDGDFKLNGGMTLYGMLYITGDWINKGGGHAEINGAIVVAGDLQSTGTPDVNYNSNILERVTNLGPYYPVPGSWKDF